MCTVYLWMEANCLHVLLAKHCGKPHHFPSKKNIPSVIHFYPNRWSMLVLSEPSQGGKCGRKKEKWFSYGVTWAHKKTQFVFGMANRHNGRKVYCLLLPTVNTFLFLCSHTGKRLATQDCLQAIIIQIKDNLTWNKRSHDVLKTHANWIWHLSKIGELWSLDHSLLGTYLVSQ